MSSGWELGRNLVRGAPWEPDRTAFEEGQAASERGGDKLRDTVRGSAGAPGGPGQSTAREQ